MKLEHQVTNRELSQRLWDAGLRCKTLWYWCNDKSEIWESGWELEVISKAIFFSFSIPAYTVAELGVVLPYHIENTNYFLLTERSNYFLVGYAEFEHGQLTAWLDDVVPQKTEADARGEALLWLINNGHLKPDGVKL